MGKLDDLRRSMGANVTESASRRDQAVSPITASLASLSSARTAGVARSKNALEVALDRIEPDPAQPREEFDPEALERLAASMKQRGQLQPVRVRWDEGRGVYVLICGERRWRAAKMAGLSTLACVVSEGQVDAGELLALQLIENCVREDLAPIEQARAYRTLMDRAGWSGNRLSQELGINQSSVVHALALLELPSDVQGHVEQGELSPSTAYELSKAGDAETIRAVAEEVISSGLTRAEAVERVRKAAGRTKGRGGNKARPPKPRTFRLAGGGKVTIEPSRKAVGADVILEMAREVVRLLEAEMEEQEAA
jgi:ParB family transcriptional regulator, chromosome partitioning protein